MKDCNRYIEIGGKRRSVNEWSDISGIPAATLRKRLSRHWPSDRVLAPLVLKEDTGYHMAEMRYGKEYGRY
jgi:hypothetical protein